ncbi:MAG: hypothetical protein B7Z39_03085, partial [Novosphingobium sp. 12-64-8]
MSGPVLSSNLDSTSPEAQSRAAHNRALADELRARVAQAALGGDERSRERHVSRGKLLPRDRVERLLDPGSPFLEGATASVAGAALLQRLTSATKRMKGNTLSSQVDLQGPLSKTGFI